MFTGSGAVIRRGLFYEKGVRMKKFYAGLALIAMTTVLAVTGCPDGLSGGDSAYSIALDQSGTYTFPDASAGYGVQAAKTVTVTNTGTQATGALTIGKSGTNAASFTVSKDGISDIAVNGSDSFTVVPVTGLPVGTHTATITVTGGNDISASFNVSFTIDTKGDPVYSIGLSETGTYVFPGVSAGYEALTARTVTITNTGNRAAGPLTIGKSGTNAAGFTVSKDGIGDIAVSGTDSFTVVPVTELVAGTYTATITVTGGNGISASFDVSFTVNPAGDPPAPVYSIGLSETATYVFTAGTAGYSSAPAAKTVTVTNTGNQATGALTIGKSGPNPAGFTVSKDGIGGIAVSGTDSFTVVPVTGLPAGTASAQVSV
jgi:hypothetical protein